MSNPTVSLNPPDFVLIYVDNPLVTAEFYSGILGNKPVEASKGFAMFVLENGLKLGFWLRPEVEPKPLEKGTTHELVFGLKSKAEVDAVHAQWKQKGLPIAQSPTEMDFGYTFVALDPDGHRLRVYVVAERPV